MNRLRAPILTDLAGLVLVAALWLAALSVPIQSANLRFGLLAGAYCGDSLPDGTPDADTGCHPCCLPGLLQPDTLTPSAPIQTVWFIAAQPVTEIVPPEFTARARLIRAPPGFAA